MATKVGHYAVHVIIAIVLLVIANSFFPIESVILQLALSLLAIIGILILWLALHTHNHKLCEACIRRLPLNASARANTYRHQLKTVHMTDSTMFIGIFFVAIVASSVIATTLIGRWVFLAVQLGLIYLLLSISTHRAYQPWCPYCNNGGEKKKLKDTVPDLPSPDSRRRTSV